jgi:hypothetical protein
MLHGLWLLTNMIELWWLPQAESNTFLDLFYDKYISQLIAVLSDSCEPPRPASAPAAKAAASTAAAGGDDAKLNGAAPAGAGGGGGATPSAIALIADLLCFCVQQHSYRIKCAPLPPRLLSHACLLTHQAAQCLFPIPLLAQVQDSMLHCSKP